MKSILAVGSGINLKTGKIIRPFVVTEATSRKGLEGLAENILIRNIVVIPHTSHEKITELINLKQASERTDLGIKRSFAYPGSHPRNQIVLIARALAEACRVDGTQMRADWIGEIRVQNILDVLETAGFRIQSLHR
ncbi:MAG: hypothetical protein PHV13_05030 [Candidatus ainarchaeum sp.]|nr:hypothetical protein [Candidatus ainarchaeum sp.]